MKKINLPNIPTLTVFLENIPGTKNDLVSVLVITKLSIHEGIY